MRIERYCRRDYNGRGKTVQCRRNLRLQNNQKKVISDNHFFHNCTLLEAFYIISWVFLPIAYAHLNSEFMVFGCAYSFY